MKVLVGLLLTACQAPSEPPTAPSLPAATRRADLEASPTVRLTASEVGGTVAGKHRDLAGSQGLLARLLEELAAVRHPTRALLQSETTDGKVIERVVETATRAGFQHVTFAVEKR
jgi:hypothetical protein